MTGEQRGTPTASAEGPPHPMPLPHPVRHLSLHSSSHISYGKHWRCSEPKQRACFSQQLRWDM